jgi:tetratricopeptide (TPR) repeat protein
MLQVALGVVLFLSEWDWPAAERSLKRALDISRGHSEALLYIGSLMEVLRKLEEGLRFKQQALARDPRSPIVLVQIAWSYWHQRRYDDATAWAKSARYRSAEFARRGIARDPALVYLAVGPQWDSLRGDKRFDDRLERMGLPRAV